MTHAPPVHRHRSPPSAEITLEEFELYALDRLQVRSVIPCHAAAAAAETSDKAQQASRIGTHTLSSQNTQVLRTIESLRLRAVKGDEFRMKLEEVLQKCLPMSGTAADVQKDQASHFILRIAYCKT